ncbi:hypothetical protein AKJ16_DCAP23439, partial [Drosera capensis]
VSPIHDVSRISDFRDRLRSMIEYHSNDLPQVSDAPIFSFLFLIVDLRSGNVAGGRDCGGRHSVGGDKAMLVC